MRKRENERERESVKGHMAPNIFNSNEFTLEIGHISTKYRAINEAKINDNRVTKLNLKLHKG